MNTNNQKKVEVYIKPDVDYVYRELFNVYVGVGDVVIEFGNYQRPDASKVIVSERIVMTIGNAYKLMQHMENALKQAQEKIQEMVQQNSNNLTRSK